MARISVSPSGGSFLSWSSPHLQGCRAGFLAEFVPVASVIHTRETTGEITRHDREDSRITGHMFEEPVVDDDVGTPT